MINYNGTPTDVEDDIFVHEIESMSGPHPDLEIDFELFREVVVPTLT